MSSGAAPLFKKKSAGKRDVRQRAVGEAAESASIREEANAVMRQSSGYSDASEADVPSSSVVLKKRKIGAGNPLRQGTFSSRRARSGNDDVDDGDDGEDDLAGLSGLGESDSLQRQTLDARQDATRTSDWYDGGSSSGAKRSRDDDGKASPTNADGMYKGTAAYSKFTVTRDDGMSSKVRNATKGPIKGSSNVRTVTMVDYQPDVCKDYKETGYCGFGDTCKFLHDRSDYLAGWQLDSLSNGGKRREALLDNEEEDEEEDDIPFACLICRMPFTDPVVTKCGHFFCSSCAIKRFAKTSKCFACGKQTQGIFNSAQKILDRMEKIRTLKQEEREEHRWDRDEDTHAHTQQTSGALLDGVEVGDGSAEEGGGDGY